MSAEAVRFAKLFRNGNSQAVRLPRDLQFSGTKVRVRRVGNGVLLEPEMVNIDAWFEAMHKTGGVFDIERDQPITPDEDFTF